MSAAMPTERRVSEKRLSAAISNRARTAPCGSRRTLAPDSVVCTSATGRSYQS